MLRQIVGDGVFFLGRFFWFWAVAVFFVEAVVAIIEANFFAGDPHLFHLRANFEDVAVRREEGGLLAGLDGAQALGHAEDFRRVQRDALERDVSRQSMCDRLRGGVGEVAGV